MHPGAYLRSTANCFDFFIVLVSLFVEVSSSSELKFMRSLRLFRALRPLRLINRVKRLQLLIATLTHVLPELGSMFLLGLFQFMIFAILGSQMFAESLITATIPPCPMSSHAWAHSSTLKEST